MLDRSEQKLGELKDALGDSVTTTVGDVRSLADNDRAVEDCLAAFGRLDCAIGNAGIWDYSTNLLDLPADKLMMVHTREEDPSESWQPSVQVESAMKQFI